jgi:tetratricopeptide (TPR) repeat protein
LVLFAFLLGSAPVRKTDVWLHLATGRALVQGTWRFGPDPFLHTGAGEVVVAHSWLYDLLTYGLFQVAGEVGLVALRCSLLAALAIVLLRLASPNAPTLQSTACLTLALLAVCVRVPLQPVCVSYLLVALTLLWLTRAQQGHGGRRLPWLRAYGPLLFLFALWSNLDGWYLLGPLTVFLFLAGAAMSASRGEPVNLAGLALFLPAGIAACLLNPWHIHSLCLPSELGLAGVGFLSPLQRSYWTSIGWTPAGLAWVPLALLGMVSFVLSSQGRSSWRLPVWLGFFVLAVSFARAIPFFAIVAGPVLALNMRDYGTRLAASGQRRSGGRWSAIGAAAALPAGLALLIAAWPGWLQGPPYGRRAWSVVMDSSLLEAARGLEKLRDQGVLSSDSRGFNFSPEAASALAWAAPHERMFFNGRGPAETTAAFLDARRALLDSREGATYRDVFRAHHIDHLILYDTDVQRLAHVFESCMAQPAEWVLLYLDGRTVIFGWRDPIVNSAALGGKAWSAAARGLSERGLGAGPLPALVRVAEAGLVEDRFAAARLDPAREALSPEAARVVSGSGQLREPQPFDVLSLFLEPDALVPAEASEAALCSRLFRLYSREWPQRQAFIWDLAQQSSALGFAARPSLSELFRIAAATLPRCRALYVRNHDDGPPGLLYRAVRAARRATQANPSDPQGYLELGRAHYYLLRGTRERAWSPQFRGLAEVRQLQAITALRQALVLDPDLLEAHVILADLYKALGYFDITLEHLKAIVRLRGQGHRGAGEGPEDARAGLQSAASQLDSLEPEVLRHVSVFTVNANKAKPLDRAGMAMSHGLAGKALEILLAERDIPAATGPEGVELELNLLLLSGRHAEAQDWLGPQLEELLGAARYHWWKAMVAVVRGGYDAADLELVHAIPRFPPTKQDGEAPSPPRPPLQVRSELAQDIASMFLRAAREVHQGREWFDLPYVRQRIFRFRMEQATDLLQHEADINVTRGALFLERGDIKAAQDTFQRALSVWGDEAGSRRGGHLDFRGRIAAQRMVDLLENRP